MTFTAVLQVILYFFSRCVWLCRYNSVTGKSLFSSRCVGVCRYSSVTGNSLFFFSRCVGMCTVGMAVLQVILCLCQVCLGVWTRDPAVPWLPLLPVWAWAARDGRSHCSRSQDAMCATSVGEAVPSPASCRNICEHTQVVLSVDLVICIWYMASVDQV